VRPVLNYSKQIRANQRYQENMGMAHNKLQAQDNHLDHAENTLVRAKQLTIKAISGAVNDQDKEIMADEMQQMKKELLDTANAQINERFLFSGYEEETKPFQINDSGVVEYHGDDHAKKVDIAPGEKLAVSIPGRELFLGQKDVDEDSQQEKIGANVFEALDNMETLIRSGERKETGSFGGNYEGWEYNDSNNYDEISFDMNLNDKSLGTVAVDMNEVDLPKEDSDIALELGNQILQLNPDSGNVGPGSQFNDGEHVIFKTNNGKEVKIERDGSEFKFETKNNASFEITNFSEKTITDSNPDTNPENSAELDFAWNAADGKKNLNLRSGSIRSTTLSGHLESLDDGATRLRKYRGEMGINMNRVETSIDAKAQAENDLKQILGKYEDADIAQTSSQIVQQETALKAALNVSSRMSEISILNYM